MPDQTDFERAWLTKFARSLHKVAGEQVRREVMEGSDELCSASDRQEVIDWSCQAMARLEGAVDGDQGREVMTGCACQYPRGNLADVRRAYADSGDVDVALSMLHEKFVSLLRDTMRLDEDTIATIIANGWGLAGVRKGDTILATKIPKSEYLMEYMRESDRDKKRAIYCHCPRVRDALKTSGTIPEVYCYCGAGYYKGIWEEILQQPVEVELLKSVLKGDDVCTVAIHLPRSAVGG